MAFCLGKLANFFDKVERFLELWNRAVLRMLWATRR
jgi:hypothetical protein